MMALDRSPELFSLFPLEMNYTFFVPIVQTCYRALPLRLPVSEKNFEIFFPCSYVPTCEPWGSPELFSLFPLEMNYTFFVPIVQTCYRALPLRLPVSEKNFEIFFPCSCVPTCEPWGWTSFDARDVI